MVIGVLAPPGVTPPQALATSAATMNGIATRMARFNWKTPSGPQRISLGPRWQYRPLPRATPLQRALLNAYARRDRGALECAESDFHGDGKKCDEQRTCEQPVVLLEREPVHDVPPQAAECDEGAERGCGDDVHRRRADPREDQRKSERKLDPPEDAGLAHAHAAGRLDHVLVDAAHGDIRVGEDRRERERDQGEERRPEAEPVLHAEQRAGDRDRERDRGQRRDRATDVRDVHGDEAEAAGVPEEQADRQRDEHADQHRETGHREVLEDPGLHGVRPLIVRRVDEPARNVAEQRHATRVHGVSRPCTRTSSASATTARATERTAPAISSVVKKRWSPMRMRNPKPPCPISAVTVTSPMVLTVATRTPAMMTAAASGSSIRQRISRGV